VRLITAVGFSLTVFWIWDVSISKFFLFQCIARNITSIFQTMFLIITLDLDWVDWFFSMIMFLRGWRIWVYLRYCYVIFTAWVTVWSINKVTQLQVDLNENEGLNYKLITEIIKKLLMGQVGTKVPKFIDGDAAELPPLSFWQGSASAWNVFRG